LKHKNELLRRGGVLQVRAGCTLLDYYVLVEMASSCKNQSIVYGGANSSYMYDTSIERNHKNESLTRGGRGSFNKQEWLRVTQRGLGQTTYKKEERNKIHPLVVQAHANECVV
jgi:hypothetical protein